MYHMKTVTIRDLRHDPGKVEALVNQGNEVLITKRGKPVMRISKPDGAGSRRPPADFRRIREEVSAGRVMAREDVRHMWKILRDERVP
jgi:antitoxin (DNA-binding transcriptional repressor) of toxin-antitoxin stability system